RDLGAQLDAGHLDEEHGDIGGAGIAERPAGEGDRVIPPERVGVQALERRKLGQLRAGHPKDGARRGAGRRGVDDHAPIRAVHLEGDVHTSGTAVNEAATGGNAALPEMPDEDRTNAVVTAQKISTADDEHFATEWLNVVGVLGLTL